MAQHDTYFTTHVLNTTKGGAAEGVVVELWRLDPSPGLIVKTVTTKDGRNADPLLHEDGFIPGTYELRFHVGPYFAALGLAADPPYLDVVPVRVTLKAGQGHYHVPLLCSPFSYTTYRGS
jgi:5-hydroxyisourate hydrolase